MYYQYKNARNVMICPISTPTIQSLPVSQFSLVLHVFGSFQSFSVVTRFSAKTSPVTSYFVTFVIQFTEFNGIFCCVALFVFNMCKSSLQVSELLHVGECVSVAFIQLENKQAGFQNVKFIFSLGTFQMWLLRLLGRNITEVLRLLL